MPEKDNAAQAVVVGGVGTAFGVALGLLLAGKPVEAAPPEAKWNYLVGLLEQLTNGNLTIIQLLEKIEAAQAVVDYFTGKQLTNRVPDEERKIINVQGKKNRA